MSQANWLPDDATTNCTGCDSKFDLLNRKHHCRSCKRIFCHPCSQNNIDLPHLGLKGKQRVCKQCYISENKRLEWQMKYIPKLQSGSIMLHLHRFSQDSRFVRLSNDAKTIELCEINTKQIKETLPLSSIQNIVEGKTTSFLAKQKK